MCRGLRVRPMIVFGANPSLFLKVKVFEAVVERFASRLLTECSVECKDEGDICKIYRRRSARAT